MVNELKISTSSAQILADAISKNLEKSSLSEWAIPLTALIVSVMSLFIAWRAYQTSRQNFASSVQKLFFETMALLPYDDDTKPLTKRQLELMANYMEYVCFLYYRKSLKLEDIELMTEVFKNKKYIDYVRNYRKNNKRLMSNYWRWLKENKMV